MCSGAIGAPQIPRRSSMRSAQTWRNSWETPTWPTTSPFWCCAGTDLADADLDPTIAWLGYPFRGTNQGLPPAAACGEYAAGGNAHPDQDRLHALGALQG